MSYERFLDDAEHLAILDRQRFVNVRPTREVAAVHTEIQNTLRRGLSAWPVSYPARAHVTLGAFVAGSSLEAVQGVVESWARGVPPLRIEIERVACFPSPFRAVFLQVRRTPALVTALTSLRRGAAAARLVSSTPIAPDDWVFHMSLAYCAKLTPAQWDEATRFVATLDAAAAHVVVDEVEVVAIDGGVEYSGGVYALHEPAV